MLKISVHLLSPFNAFVFNLKVKLTFLPNYSLTTQSPDAKIGLQSHGCYVSKASKNAVICHVWKRERVTESLKKSGT